ncbi:MAG: hypothetical protein R6T83_03880 [Salinibacter sp.]
MTWQNPNYLILGLDTEATASLRKPAPNYTVNFVFTGMSELKIPEIQHVISSNVEKSP